MFSVYHNTLVLKRDKGNYYIGCQYRFLIGKLYANNKSTIRLLRHKCSAYLTLERLDIFIALLTSRVHWTRVVKTALKCRAFACYSEI